VEYVSLSYMGLRRRTKFIRPWVLADKFPDEQHVFLDSGAYTVNNAAEDKYTTGELKDIAAHYMSFTYDNIERLDMVSEFDARVLGQQWIEAMREDFWDDLGEKFLPVWHSETGLDELHRLARKYERVAVGQTELAGRNLTPELNGLVNKYGTKLHGIAMTKPDEMRAIKWDSVASTSWISPSQFGDTIVWTGKELKRYPMKYKDQSRKQHRTLFTREGFDSAKIEADDTKEVLRLSIWSWQQQVEDINSHRHVVSTTPDSAVDDSCIPDPNAVGTGEIELAHPVPTELMPIVVRDASERTNLPVLGLSFNTESYVDETGVHQEREVPLIVTRSESQRICDTCFLSSKCPAFKPNNTCAYNIPIQIRTREQLKSLNDAMIEMQTQRIMFMRMAEEIEGGYADPNLSSELDRLARLIKAKTDSEAEGFSLKIEAKERGNSNRISTLFGSIAGQRAMELDEPLEVPKALEAMGIIDAELVDLPEYGNEG
jgi:hypothetical protein